MPDIKLKNGSGVEQTYTGIDTITVPLADGSGSYTYGFTDENLNLSDGNEHSFFFANGSPIYEEKLYKDNYIIKRADLSNITTNSSNNYAGRNLFYNNLFIEDLSDIIIGNQGIAATSYDSLFYGCRNLRKLPNFDFIQGSIFANQTASSFVGCYKLEQSEMEKVYQFISAFNGCSQNCQLRDCYKITEFDWSQIDLTTIGDDFSPYRIDVGSGMINLRKLVLPAICTKTEATSNQFEARYASYPMLGDVYFVTDTDGTPFKSKMKSQTVEFGGYSTSYYWGNGFISSDEYLKTGIDKTHNICGSTIEETQTNYNNMKQYDDWHCSNKSVTYNGSSVYLGTLFSRFNHDSMVKIINTIMDTSEYLAEKGGTNTIKFHKYQGDLTDEGGASDLTEEEIAVAAAKGWTVAII